MNYEQLVPSRELCEEMARLGICQDGAELWWNCYKNKEVLFVECKVCERDKLLQNLRPHQKAFHHKYSKIFDGLYILQRGLSSREVFLYGSKNFDFLDGASTFEHCARAADRENWDAIREKLNERHTISSSVAQMGK